MGITAAVLFATVLVLASFAFNRWLLGGELLVDRYRLALTASAVLLLAVLAEASINPLFELWLGGKLWEYRVLPLHNANVSALGLVVWTAYGVHLYFTRQSLERRLRGRWKGTCGKSLIIGLEAPFLFEVSGNLVFLTVMHNYYAYYLPADLHHLTSWRVVPVYMVCVFCGLVILGAIERLPRTPLLPGALFAGGGLPSCSPAQSDGSGGAMTSSRPSRLVTR
jgi:hypothetical protein